MDSSYMIFVWLGVIVLAVILEAVTTQMVSIWFVAGGLVGLVANALDIPPWPQVLIASVVTLILLVFTRRLLKRKIMPKKVSTNADRCIGATGIVTEAISNLENHGQIKVAGSIWTARTETPVAVEKGVLVKVLRIEGVKLIVEPAKN